MMKRILLIILSCLSIGAVASAAGSSATEVQIAIEASEIAATENETDAAVQTGDDASASPYFIVMGAIATIGAICMWKKKRGVIAILAVVLSLFFANHAVLAAETSENVNVTIPACITVSFDETGKNSISEFEICNQSLVPITIEKIKATECNNWTLCEKGEEIPVDTKKIAFQIEGQSLRAEENTVKIPIKENTSKRLNLNIERGAWTYSSTMETALQLEFEYAIGVKEFRLGFDTNGSEEKIDTWNVYNGTTIELPKPERDGYALAGWEDSNGNLYTNQFVMPIGDVTLKAKWNETVAYAIYLASDTSLRFLRTAEPIVVGGTYDGKTITAVYTGFEDVIYTSDSQIPWYDKNYYQTRKVTNVIVEDEIHPRSTAHWFQWMYDCKSMDIEKLDTSRVTDMSYMFAWVGFNPEIVTIKGVETLDVSNVTTMDHTFAFVGRNAKYFVTDLSRWDVSKVTNMTDMFYGAGLLADWYLDCSRWNVKKVTNYYNFDLLVDEKVVDPAWGN